MLTPLCGTLGIAWPIVQAPMNWATDARLVAAVSNAGRARRARAECR